MVWPRFSLQSAVDKYRARVLHAQDGERLATIDLHTSVLRPASPQTSRGQPPGRMIQARLEHRTYERQYVTLAAAWRDFSPGPLRRPWPLAGSVEEFCIAAHRSAGGSGILEGRTAGAARHNYTGRCRHAAAVAAVAGASHVREEFSACS